jgi:hypothetical protein
MNPQALDFNKLHTKKIKAVVNTGKEFHAAQKGGTCQKFQIVFFDGYEAEYCPLVGKADPRVQPGADLLFQVVFRGTYGDEIQPYMAGDPRPQNPNQQPAPPRVTNLHVHPAYLSLQSAIRFHAEVRKPKAGQKPELADIFETADQIQNWIEDKLNRENF